MSSNTQRRYVRIDTNANDYPQGQLFEGALVEEELVDEPDEEGDEELEDELEVELEEEPESFDVESCFLAGASLEDFFSELDRESVR